MPDANRAHHVWILHIRAIATPGLEGVSSDQAVRAAPCVSLDDRHAVLEAVLLRVREDIDRSIRMDQRSRILFGDARGE